MRILALTDCLLAYHSFWIRIGQYLKRLGNEFNITITDDRRLIEQLDAGDKLILYRYSLDWGDIGNQLIKAKIKGVTIISDVDDYLWNDGENRGWPKQRLRLYSKSLRHCHFITCSTSELKEQIEVMYREAKVILFKNTAPPVITDKSIVSDNKIRFGWTGAPWTRPYDLQDVKLLGKWVEKNKERAEIIHIGHSEREISLAEVIGIDEDVVKKIALREYDEYTKKFNFDVGLAPLKHSCFNSYKSAIKVIEYSANSIPWIASDTSVYRGLCREWAWDGRLCKTEEDWIKHAVDLLDAYKRLKEGKILKEKCEKYAPNEMGIRNWRKILQQQDN